MEVKQLMVTREAVRREPSLFAAFCFVSNTLSQPFYKQILITQRLKMQSWKAICIVRRQQSILLTQDV